MTEEEQQSQQGRQEYSHKIAQAFMNRSDSTLIMFFQDLKDILQSLEHSLKGEIPDYEKKDWKKVEGMSLMNDKGVGWVILFLQSRLNKGIFMGSLSPEQLNYRSKKAAKDLANNLYVQNEAFEIKGITDYCSIISMIDDQIFGALSRALGGAEKKFLGQSLDIKQVNTLNEPQKKKGFWGNMLNLP